MGTKTIDRGVPPDTLRGEYFERRELSICTTVASLAGVPQPTPPLVPQKSPLSREK